MASQTPVFIHNENLHIHGGQDAGELKSSLPRKKSVKPGLQERKALRDLSNAKQTQAPGSSKATALLKETSALKSGAGKVKKAAVNESALTDEELEECREWAKEGIEYAMFTGNDIQKLEEQLRKECVRKEVEMVNSAMSSWMASVRNHWMPKIAEYIEDLLKLEFEPEILLPTINDGLNSGFEEDPRLLSLPDTTYEFIEEEKFEFPLKEEYA